MERKPWFWAVAALVFIVLDLALIAFVAACSEAIKSWLVPVVVICSMSAVWCSIAGGYCCARYAVLRRGSK